MTVKKKKAPAEQVEKLTFRLWPPYTEKVFRSAQAVGISPNQFGRVATMTVADQGLLELPERLARIENELIRLRKDFNEAVRNED
jgi:multidrug resistance efflux pump